jgi:hypothetical protein
MTTTAELRATPGNAEDPQIDERWFPSMEDYILAHHCTTCDA